METFYPAEATKQHQTDGLTNSVLKAALQKFTNPSQHHTGRSGHRLGQENSVRDWVQHHGFRLLSK